MVLLEAQGLRWVVVPLEVQGLWQVVVLLEAQGLLVLQEVLEDQAAGKAPSCGLSDSLRQQEVLFCVQEESAQRGRIVDLLEGAESCRTERDHQDRASSDAGDVVLC